MHESSVMCNVLREQIKLAGNSNFFKNFLYKASLNQRIVLLAKRASGKILYLCSLIS